LADLNQLSSKPLAGSIVAALYLQRFVAPGVPWMHIDCMPGTIKRGLAGRKAGEAMGMRALFALASRGLSA